MTEMNVLTPDRPEFAPRPLDFPVIGVGASAGGLEAFETFLRHIDTDFDAAYVLVQHLDPNHKSMLTELLTRHTQLNVTQITDGTEVRPGQVYIIPSAMGLTIEDGVLSLVEFEAPRGFRRPIDDFFQALSLDQGSNACAVVLSGTGGDGTVGIRHIKEAGGLTVVQDPDEAAHDGMPSSALATGLVDIVLPTKDIPAAVARFFAAREKLEPAEEFNRDDFLHDVVTAVREQTGHDFSYYKINTVLRRIQRRMQVLDLVKAGDYIEALREQPAEAEALFQDLLINLTSFFRDPEVFNRIRQDVIPKIIASASADRPVRIWVPGCSSGEEAYSIAILAAEALNREKTKPDVQIFATDIDEEMLSRARKAVYMRSAVADLPPELLNRYFTATENGYAVIPAIRDMVRVSAHSVIKDPPFSRLDLVSCRNLLIYFDSHLQSRVLPLFHYALRPDGWLVLGSAENLAGRDDLFSTHAREERIYRKIAKAHSNFMLPLDTRRRAELGPVSRKRDEARRDGREERESKLVSRVLERYTMPHVVVNAEGVVLHSSARTSPFVQFAVGMQSPRLLELVPSELRPALRSILGAMNERRRRVIRRGIEIPADDDGLMKLDVIADPLDSVETMIVFRETGRSYADDEDFDSDIGDFHTEERIQVLEDEVRETRATLRTTVEELETSNEELKSSNEEMMSMNEELQSANEELSTVNEELKSKLDELAALNADQTNFLESTQIATVFVDNQMKVRNYTPHARKLFRFVERDKGRPLLDVRTEIDAEMLREAIEGALEGKLQDETQVAINDDTYTFRALPYRSHDNEIDGAVLVFDDVSQLVRTQRSEVMLQQSVASSRYELERLYESAPVGMAVVDAERRYRRINESLAAYNGLPAADHLGRTISHVLPDIGEKLDVILDQVFETGKGVSRWELVAPAPQDPDGDNEVFELDIYPLTNEDGQVEQVGLIVHRVTDERRMRAGLQHLMAELQHRVKNSLATVISIVRQTARNMDDGSGIADVLTRRITALASTHSLLTSADWGAISLTRIVAQELAPYNDERLSVSGPPIGIGPKAAVSLTLAMHELATNAAKYGALSSENGTLSIAWTVENGRLKLEWVERGGNDIRPPERQGFGLKFIKRTVLHDLDGSIDIDWSDDGVTITIGAELDRLFATGKHHE